MVGKEMLYRIAIVVLAIIIIAVLALSPSFNAANKKEAEENVVALYKAFGSENPEILKTVEQNGMLKVTVRFQDATGRDTVQDVFVTRDGLFLTDRLLDIKQQRLLLSQQNEFITCLAEKNVRIFGANSDSVTQAQLQLLGPFSTRLYFNCEASPQVCQQINITTIPVTFFEQGAAVGLQAPSVFSQQTGCALPGVNATANATANRTNATG